MLAEIIGRVLISLNLSNRFDNSARKIGFLIYYGPEIRTLILSGILSRVIMSGDRPVIFSKFELSESDFTEIGQVETYILPQGNSSFWRKFNGLLTSWLLKFLKANQRNLGFGDFHWSNGFRGDTSKLDFMFSLFRFPLISIMNAINYFRWDLNAATNLIIQSKVDSLIYSSYQNSNIIEFLVCARRQRINLVYILGNWKDIYINNYHQVIPNVVTYWSERLYSDSIKINKSLRSSKYIISGNPAFYRFRNFSTSTSREEFFLNYGISQEMKVILWAGSMESLISNEFKLIDSLICKIRESELNYRVILRVNPFNNYEFYNSYYRDTSEVFVCKNNWRRNVEKDITYQTEMGELEWSELLFHCDFIVSAPSTVTLEATMFNKTILNFIFDSNDCETQSLKGTLDSPFYRTLVGCNYLKVAKSMNELICLLNEDTSYLRSDKFINSIPDIISGNGVYNAELLYTEVKRCSV